ncbi:MAG TPA: DUF6544 family protein [Gemmatimonadales bacterium]|nr:DUF6544 family protein [Gemmatimonadales bacterium]
MKALRGVREGFFNVDASHGDARMSSEPDMPPPVRRYFRYALGEEQPRVRTALFHQSGFFRSRFGGDPAKGWAPFRATQRIAARPPSFVWEARIRMLPFLSVRVRDGYDAGHATMRGTLLGVVPVAKAVDGAELREGALQRWLAEAVWLPTALLPEGGVTWAPIDDRRARAAVSDAGITVSLDFEFAASGEVLAVRAPARPRAVPGRAAGFVRAPWGGRFHRWETHGGMRVPVEAEVFWELEGREECYYRGRNDRLSYRFDQ